MGTEAIRKYKKQHVTIAGPDGWFINKELDSISVSINSIVGVLLAPCTVANLPNAVLNTGASGMVTDATATTFWSVVAGSGANTVPVKSDGVNWRIG